MPEATGVQSKHQKEEDKKMIRFSIFWRKTSVGGLTGGTF